MRILSGILLMMLAFATMVKAQITRTANFENYTAGTYLNRSFYDPASGITFIDPTSEGVEFGISKGLPEFNGNNYLSDGVGGYSGYFGFTGNVPSAADQISLEIAWTGTPPGSSGITLEGFSSLNAGGTMISEQSIRNAPDPYTLQITSNQYNMNSFEVVVGAVFTGYDNISYTELPEPTGLWEVLGAIILLPIRGGK